MLPSVLIFLTCFLNYGTGQQQLRAGTCPERNGRFANPTQCDAYTECEDGVATEKLCPDGLLFNSKARYFAYPCQYPVEVNCEGRTSLQPPQSTAECPHKYGYYKVGDQKNCGQFISCVEGRAFTFDCPAGLAFNEESIRCDWPDEVKSCNAEEYLGFTCPEDSGAFSQDGFRTYRSPYDCSKYFICINQRPRLYSCPGEQGFSDEAASCLPREQVPNCIFGGLEEPSYPPLNRG